jgi:DNA repair exonuclease SbcCD ATPase subunit
MNSHNDIITGPDKLLDIINSKGEITIGFAAKQLDVTKDLISEWSDTLEKEGLINSHYTLRERYLISCKPEHATKDQIKSLKRHIKSVFNRNETSSREDILKKKEKEIDFKLDSLHKKLKNLKNFEQTKIAIEEKLQLLNSKESNLKEFEKQLKEKKTILENEQKNLGKQMVDLSEKETVLSRLQRRLKRKELLLVEKEANLMKTFSELTKQLNSVKKRKEQRDKQHSKLIKEENAVWDLVYEILAKK